MKDTNEGNNVEELINGLGVFELRAVARQLGVPSPTTKRRDELVSLIQEAINNGATIKDNSQKRGRPFKKLNVLDSLTEKINSEVIRIDFSNTKKTINFAQDSYDFKLDDDICEGIIQKYNYTIEMRDIKTGALVKFEKTEQMNELLEIGDKVKTTVNLIDGVFYASKILYINDNDYDIYRSNFISKGEPIISEETLPFASGNAVIGRRNLYRLEREIFETNHLENLLKYCEKEDYTLIILASNTSFENEIKFNKIPTVNKFMASYGSDTICNYHKVIDAINYAENLVNRGKKVVLFVADIMESVKCIDRFFFRNEEKIETYDDATRLIIQKLLKFARAYDSGVSGTLIMCYNEVDSGDRFLMNDVMKISKKIN